MKKKLTLALALSALLVSCGGNGTANEIDILIWEDVNNHELITDLFANYQSIYRQNYPDGPALKLTLQEEQESKAVSDLLLQGPSGEGPDIFAFVHDTLASAITNELIGEAMFSAEVINNHSVDSVAAFTYNNKLYGYPITAESQTLMYDKRKLDANDVTSFENILAKGEKIVLDVADTDSSGYYMFSFLTDADLFGENGTTPNSFNLDGPLGAENLTKLTKDLRGAITKGTPDSSLAIISVGEASAVVSSPYLWPLFKRSVGVENAGIAVIPSVNNNAARPFSGYKGYGVSRYAKHPHIAHDIARYLSSETAQRLRFARLGILPTFVSDEIENAVSKSDEASVFQTALDASIVMPNITQMGSFWAPANDAMTEIWNLAETATVEKVHNILTATTATIKSSF